MESSTNQVAIYKGLSVLAIFGLILSLIGDFLLSLYWASIVSAIFKIFLVASLFLLEFRQSPASVKPFSFMFYFLGRGVFYIIVSWAGGAIIIVVGAVFVGLHFANNGQEPEYMSFKRFQRLTSGLSHELPITQQYPVAHQVPLSQHNAHNNGSFPPTAGQYSNTQTNTHVPPPTSPLPVHISNEEKTEI
ncbi:uncharacterized protein EV154DRAFT_101182 [Mucor mucedo]|uniref:uncharacterized protein n=1 Tax=Mucor mucedo TaxID=29922 RepID=UPI00221ED0AB|nr:uncharacterized protein EV154DRAFT_101182 [Mucor mucedo]KAI7873230.1 hypothetical protein EV154DRAFT_101182 [Mucor mucedo]